DHMIEKELTMVGTWGTIPSSWVTTLRMMATGQINVKPIITHKLSLDEWEKGFDLMETQTAIKVLFTDLD
ncbi:MAG: zinc-dependent alcohol dehydrogenase, partial [Candidatus Thorarchaeota archaeon]